MGPPAGRPAGPKGPLRVPSVPAGQTVGMGPGPDPAVSGGLHRAAAGFDRAADQYVRARPEYPDEAIDWMVGRLDADPGARVADVGAGTGKLTAPLVRRGLAVVAVEPVADMRRALRAGLPLTPMVAALADHLPLATAGLDAVTLGQALHWFATVPAVTELARVIRPGGGLAVAWNRRDDRSRLQAQLTARLEPLRGDTPGHESGRWRAPIDEVAEFGPLERHTVEWVQHLPVEGVVDRVASISFVATADDATRTALLAEVAELARRSASGGRCALPYVTDVYVSRRR